MAGQHKIAERFTYGREKWTSSIGASLALNVLIFAVIVGAMHLVPPREPMPAVIELTTIGDSGTAGGAPQIAAPAPSKAVIPPKPMAAPKTVSQGIPVETSQTASPLQSAATADTSSNASSVMRTGVSTGASTTESGGEGAGNGNSEMGGRGTGQGEPVVVGSQILQSAYPAAPRNKRGSVGISVHIGVDGTVLEATVISSSGDSSLDNFALRVVKNSWRFAPKTVDGVPTEDDHSVVLTW